MVPTMEKRKTIAAAYASVILYRDVAYYRYIVDKIQRKMLFVLPLPIDTMALHLQAIERSQVYSGGTGLQQKNAIRERTTAS